MSVTHKTTVTTVGGDVFLALPEDMYIQLTPEQARKLAVSLFTKANEAEGLAAPEVIVLQREKVEE